MTPTPDARPVSEEMLAEIRERDLRHRDGRTLMKDIAEGGRDRRALLSHVDYLRALLIEAEALLCDQRGGVVCNALARRIRAVLSPAEVGPPARQFPPGSLADAIEDAQRHLAVTPKRYGGKAEVGGEKPIGPLPPDSAEGK